MKSVKSKSLMVTIKGTHLIKGIIAVYLFFDVDFFNKWCFDYFKSRISTKLFLG